ncbi:hypothetical protein IHV25_08330 [Phaeovibrio sulfidiphilus]|uniref:Mpv17 / PMP22 family protein n=2 Tax=Phaeovibrio sulfidiphilus TaxID=1220600 RepID=A0A8J7CDD1_9PROT|nr:hypothetical protein [Phaeovibrio sulfidiphilus]
MGRADALVVGIVIAVITACALTPNFLDHFITISKEYPYLSSFVKFAVLCTFGEMIGLRITNGVYNRSGFGILPRALVWGFLGMGIKAAFVVYAGGVPAFLGSLGWTVTNPAELAFGSRLLMAFCISVTINLTFAPVFMTFHRVTDNHILATGGTIPGFFSRPIAVGKILQDTNWQSLWGFVFKKTIPLFWIPAHTVTFMLPPYFQAVFAAFLGVILGVFLAFAALKKSAA